MAPARSKAKAEIRTRQLDWLKWVLNRRRESASELAVNAGLADVTLTRFLNSADYAGTFRAETIEALTRYTGLPGPDSYRNERARFDEEAAEYFSTNYDAHLAAAVQALLKDRPGAAPKILQTGALQDHGFLEGDIVIVDVNERWRPGDAIAANVYDLQGGAETVYRIYQRAGSIDLLLPPDDKPGTEPQLVDGVRIQIRATVTEGFRPRLSRVKS